LPPPAKTTVSNCFERKASKDRVFMSGLGDFGVPEFVTSKFTGLRNFSGIASGMIG
jgi:hypothetical protein